jgi:hypothetical protein
MGHQYLDVLQLFHDVQSTSGNLFTKMVLRTKKSVHSITEQNICQMPRSEDFDPTMLPSMVCPAGCVLLSGGSISPFNSLGHLQFYVLDASV